MIEVIAFITVCCVVSIGGMYVLEWALKTKGTEKALKELTQVRLHDVTR